VNNCIEYSNAVLHCLLDCALEYTMDHRGDVGVWVREAAITSLEVLVLTIFYFIIKYLTQFYFLLMFNYLLKVVVLDLTDIQPNILDENTIKQVMCALVRQGVDRIDKIRGLSCMVITNLLHRLVRKYF